MPLYQFARHVEIRRFAANVIRGLSHIVYLAAGNVIIVVIVNRFAMNAKAVALKVRCVLMVQGLSALLKR